MENFINGVMIILKDVPEYITLVGGVLAAFIALFSAIPGDQPEKTLQKIVKFLAKFSRKKK